MGSQRAIISRAAGRTSRRRARGRTNPAPDRWQANRRGLRSSAIGRSDCGRLYRQIPPAFSVRANAGMAGKIRFAQASAMTRKELRAASRTPAFIASKRHLLRRTNVTVARLRGADQACAAAKSGRESRRGEQECQQDNTKFKKSHDFHGDPPEDSPTPT